MKASHWICPGCRGANYNSLLRCTCDYKTTYETEIPKENITLFPVREGQERITQAIDTPKKCQKRALAPFLRSEDLSREPWPLRYIIFVIPIFFINKFTAAINPYLIKDTDVVLRSWLPMTYLMTVMILYQVTIIAVTAILKKRHLCSPPAMMREPLFLKEVMWAFLIVLLVAVATAPINAVADLVFMDKSSSGPWEFLCHPPANALFSLAILLLSFTLVPVAQEWPVKSDPIGAPIIRNEFYGNQKTIS
jgi:hypothetical protein